MYHGQEDMNIASYGGGTNSTAMLIECVNKGVEVELILFADTGGEKSHTYKYIKTFSKWLVAHGMPEIITVRTHLESLYEDCMKNKCLPSVAYGFKSCSDKWKIRPVDKYIRKTYPDQKIIKIIGIDGDESHRAIDSRNKWSVNKFPLIEYEWGRRECIEAIEKAGLPSPGKSACYFCPSSKASEVKALAIQYPELAERALAMEANAELTSIKGLGRNWAWKELLATDDMFEGDYEQFIELACGCYDG